MEEEKDIQSIPRNKDTGSEEKNDSLEEQFLKLSAEYKTKRETYEKEVLKRKNRIKKLHEEIQDLERLEREEEIVQTSVTEAEKEPIIMTPEPSKDEIKKTSIEKDIEKSKRSGQEKVDEETDKIIEDLSTAEQNLLKETMEEDNPLPFESIKVKRDLRTFVQNQIIKRFSGLVVPEKIKKLVYKITKRLLIPVVAISLWPDQTAGGYYTTPDSNLDNEITILTEAEVLKNNIDISLPSTTTLETYDRLPENAQNIYLYSLKNINESYIILDKPSATMYLIGEDKSLIAEFPVLLGQTKGETRNMADPESDVAIGATTPAGKYRLGKVGITGIMQSDSILYQGRIMAVLGANPGLAIHMTYPKEFEERTEALNTSTIDDNRMSWGCINVSPENFDKFIKPNFTHGYAEGLHYIFITPDTPSDNSTHYTLNPETGKLEIKI